MRKLFEVEWQGIDLATIGPLSSRSLAGPEFYQRFYDEFFSRYERWADLSPVWRREKESCADLILSRLRPASRILSVGCGIGYVEHCIHRKRPDHDLFVHEVAPLAWTWIRDEFPAHHKVVGLLPDCLPPNCGFDMIYISAVEYAMSDETLVSLLARLRTRLETRRGEEGQLMIVTPSVQREPATLSQRARAIASRARGAVDALLDRTGVRPRGQFWGWARTRRELHALIQRAGFRTIEDGYIEPARANYWISGR